LLTDKEVEEPGVAEVQSMDKEACFEGELEAFSNVRAALGQTGIVRRESHHSVEGEQQAVYD
jgi:hypothetical protein